MTEQRQEPHFSEAATDAASLSSSTSQPLNSPSSAAFTVRRRWLRAMLWGLALCTLGMAALLSVAWWWMGQPYALQQTLTQAARWMPADQKLESSGVDGDLRQGGHIAWLRWSSPSMQVEIKNANIAWSLAPLLRRELRIDQLHLQTLHLHSTPQPKDDTPTDPLQSLLLPLRMDVPVRIDLLHWQGPPAIEVRDLQGHYRYNGSHHEAQISSLHYEQGSYEADVQLQAAAPMQLQAALQATLKAPLPSMSSAKEVTEQPSAQMPDPTLDIQAQAHITGTLATEAAKLQVQLNAHTVESEPLENLSVLQQPLSVEAQASIRPWQSQPLEQARAELRHVDVARFLTQGPRTNLSGLVEAIPQPSGGWDFQAEVSNTVPGPWDKQALPVRQLITKANFDGVHTWQVTEAQIFLPTPNDGALQAQGSYDTATGALQAKASLQAINPASLYSTLDSSPLNGQLAATSTQPQPTPETTPTQPVSPQVQFTLDIEAQGRARSSALRIDAARAQGTWQAPQLQLRDVHVQALGAQLQSPTLTINSDNLHLAGQAELHVPGAQMVLNGHIAPDDGIGQLQLQLRSAEQLAGWLQQLPGVPQTLAKTQLAGQGTAAVQWKGGWHKLQQRLQDPTAPVQASGLQLDAQINVPRLRYTSPDGSVSEVQRLQLRLQGSPEKLQADLAAQAYLNEQVLQLDTALHAGLRTGQGAGSTDWHAQIQRLGVRWQPDAKSAAWQATLLAPVALSQHTQGRSAGNIRITGSEGRLQVTPPDKVGQQQANLQWQPLVVRQASNGTWAVQSKGLLQNVPLAWVDAFSPDMNRPLLASAGISGDLILQGQWDIDTTGRQWRTNVQIERASGDIRLAVEDSDAAPITVVRSSGATSSDKVQARQVMQSGRGVRARLQELRLQLGTQGNRLHANLAMTSERAGQMQVEMQSPLRSTHTGLHWPENAPLSGRIRADLPNIGFWALFAPPGWRVGGTFNADVQIAGTRKNPQWNGSLQADALSLSSLLDGVNLNNGRLRARLQDTRLDITELYLQGGKGSSARILGMSGNLTSAPEHGGTLTGSGYVIYDPNAPKGSSGIAMDIRAQAKQLQVLVRADRQLSTSGTLHANLDQGQMTLRGDLTVDRAAILLADESAPKLDSDVHIHSVASRKTSSGQTAPPPAVPPATSTEGSVQATKEPDILIKLDLGPDFALQGYGITTRLQGQLAITGGPRITGEIHTVHGRYRAWGQSLDVEKGTIRFNGPYDNPSIDIWAIRPNIAVRAGVKVTGSATSPRVALFSEPDMSDAEKLSWVVMGRDTSNGGAETALLQQAALALLSGGGTGENFAGRVGLDEIGFQGGGDGNNAEGAALTLGKRLSQDLYVSYQQSLSGAMGTLYIFYDLSRRLTLRGQTGEQTAVDLIYTRKKD